MEGKEGVRERRLKQFRYNHFSGVPVRTFYAYGVLDPSYGVVLCAPRGPHVLTLVFRGRPGERGGRKGGEGREGERGGEQG